MIHLCIITGIITGIFHVWESHEIIVCWHVCACSALLGSTAVLLVLVVALSLIFDVMWPLLWIHAMLHKRVLFHIYGSMVMNLFSHNRNGPSLYTVPVSFRSVRSQDTLLGEPSTARQSPADCLEQVPEKCATFRDVLTQQRVLRAIGQVSTGYLPPGAGAKCLTALTNDQR